MKSFNTPDLWLSALPQPKANDHKYTRGHAVVIGANNYTGATRLAAASCSRIGSGLVTVLSPSQAPVYRMTLPADIMVREDSLADINRPTVVLAGPGGCDDAAAEAIRDSDTQLNLVLDADAIRLCGTLDHETQVATPHAGEFQKYFGDLSDDPLAKVEEIARARNITLVLKGAKTLIAAPDGRLVENTHASPYLAKAGSGDVLAGMIAGLVAQGMPAFEAACAGVWMHGDASLRVGPGLIPQDLIAEFRAVLGALLA